MRPPNHQTAHKALPPYIRSRAVVFQALLTRRSTSNCKYKPCHTAHACMWVYVCVWAWNLLCMMAVQWKFKFVTFDLSRCTDISVGRNIKHACHISRIIAATRTTKTTTVGSGVCAYTWAASHCSIPVLMLECDKLARLRSCWLLALTLPQP